MLYFAIQFNLVFSLVLLTNQLWCFYEVFKFLYRIFNCVI